MKLHRFIRNFNLKKGNIIIKDEELFNQFRNVLKLKVGEKIILGDGKLNEGMAEIKSYGKDSVEFEVGEINTNKSESKIDVILYCAILKKENFELVVQKATEIGVKEIVPLVTARTVKLDVRKDRLGKIIREAAEQSGRGIVPILHDPIGFEQSTFSVNKNNVNLFFDQSGENLQHHKSADRLTMLADEISIFVGPEGGWTPEEIEIAKKSGFKIISLGKTILRAETAAIIGVYLAISGSESSS